jgi:hypothetical protein
MCRSHLPHTGSNDVLTLSRKNGQFDITHVSAYTGRQIVYSFSDDFLPASAMRHIITLGVFLQKEVTYMLNSTDDSAVVEVLHKLDSERHSSYIFSDHLQKTYLIELIHLITKLHFRNAV